MPPGRCRRHAPGAADRPHASSSCRDAAGNTACRTASDRPAPTGGIPPRTRRASPSPISFAQHHFGVVQPLVSEQRCGLLLHQVIGEPARISLRIGRWLVLAGGAACGGGGGAAVARRCASSNWRCSSLLPGLRLDRTRLPRLAGADARPPGTCWGMEPTCRPRSLDRFWLRVSLVLGLRLGLIGLGPAWTLLTPLPRARPSRSCRRLWRRGAASSVTVPASPFKKASTLFVDGHGECPVLCCRDYENPKPLALSPRQGAGAVFSVHPARRGSSSPRWCACSARRSSYSPRQKQRWRASSAGRPSSVRPAGSAPCATAHLDPGGHLRPLYQVVLVAVVARGIALAVPAEDISR